MLVQFVVIYLVISVGLGVYAATKVKNSEDYVAAGRSLPLPVVIAMVFATWFGAETVLGIPGTFVQGNLGSLISDPFGAAFCLILFGLVFARPLYRKHMLTIGDFYRDRFGRPVEIAVAIAIALSYLGWVSAQVTALGLVFNVLSGDAISMTQGIVVGSAIVLVYTLFGGMWSVAITTFFQMIVIVVGLLWIASMVSDLTGGIGPVIEHASKAGKFEFWPEIGWATIITFVAGFLTMGFGSIPQQDVFQRANSAKNENIAVWGTVTGGIAYLLFAAVPIYLAYSAFIIDPEMTNRLLEEDPQLVLPNLILHHLPIYAQVIFYGALLAVIMSTASGTLLAPSVTLSENVIKEMLPAGKLNDRQFLWMTRAVVVVFSLFVTIYALWSVDAKTSIHSMVENAYKVTLVMALVPLFAGLYWKRSTNSGAIASIICGLLVWIPMEFIAPDGAMPPHFAGFIAAIIAMVGVSLFYKEETSLTKSA